MTRIEKTVFISYRRTNLPWALCIYQNLTMHGYDVFFDYQSIDSGNFENVIIENIKARAHFLVILTPSALERCKEPNDWLRREIENAIDEKRNIVPLMLENFDFGSPLAKQALTGKLSTLDTYNGLKVFSEYFFEAMDKLRDRYLKVEVSHIPITSISDQKAREITESQKAAANEAALVEKEQLTAQSWFERGYVFQKDKNYMEANRCYSEFIRFKPDLAEAYYNRGIVRRALKDLEGALADYDEAIRLNPDFAEAYNNRGIVRRATNDLQGALLDYNKTIQLMPENAEAHFNRGVAHSSINNLEAAISSYIEAIRINPEFAQAYYNSACIESIRGEITKSLNYLRLAIHKRLEFKQNARQDPDFENIRNDPRFNEIVGE